jgi:hypothetical protein
VALLLIHIGGFVAVEEKWTTVLCGPTLYHSLIQRSIPPRMTRLLVCLCLVVVCVLSLSAGALGKNRLMGWLCLEFCDETQQVISANLHEIEQHKDLFAAVSFEKYTLGTSIPYHVLFMLRKMMLVQNICCLTVVLFKLSTRLVHAQDQTPHWWTIT